MRPLLIVICLSCVHTLLFAFPGDNGWILQGTVNDQATGEPRRQLQPAFRGTVYVLSGEYVLLEVELEPNEIVRFPPPVRGFDLSYEQQFSNFGSQYWLPVDMRINGSINIEMIGLRFPSIMFRQISRMSNYEVNTTLPNTIYESECDRACIFFGFKRIQYSCRRF